MLYCHLSLPSYLTLTPSFLLSRYPFIPVHIILVATDLHMRGTFRQPGTYYILYYCSKRAALSLFFLFLRFLSLFVSLFFVPYHSFNFLSRLPVTFYLIPLRFSFTHTHKKIKIVNWITKKKKKR